jgi:uncharacterized protein (TIGR01777 family)
MHLPAGLRPHITGDGTVVGCCLLDVDDLRPSPLPSACGMRVRAAAHRISVEWTDDRGGENVVVYVPIRHTDAPLARLFGDRLFPGVHAAARVELADDGHRLDWSVVPHDHAHAHAYSVRVRATTTTACATEPCEPIGGTGLGGHHRSFAPPRRSARRRADEARASAGTDCRDRTRRQRVPLELRERGAGYVVSRARRRDRVDICVRRASTSRSRAGVKVVLAGGTGALGRRLADAFRTRGDEVVILTRNPRPDIEHRQVEWDGRTVGTWARELEGAIVVNLAGELVDRRPTRRNVDVLRRSRVEPTRALVDATAHLHDRPRVWLQMSTLAIYGDAGQRIVDETSPVAEGPPQMPGVARPWEAAVDGAAVDRLVVMRTGIVLDNGTPAFARLARITKLGLGGRIGGGEQWVSWIHVDDFVRAVLFLCESTLDGIVHVTAPNPVQNRDMMAAFRRALHRPWSPPTPTPLARLGAWLMRTDPALALTGRRAVPQRLLDDGFRFEHATFADAVADLVARGA